jgi:hypothetical protein
MYPRGDLPKALLPVARTKVLNGHADSLNVTTRDPSGESNSSLRTPPSMLVEWLSSIMGTTNQKRRIFVALEAERDSTWIRELPSSRHWPLPPRRDRSFGPPSGRVEPNASNCFSHLYVTQRKIGGLIQRFPRKLVTNMSTVCSPLP